MGESTIMFIRRIILALAIIGGTSLQGTTAEPKQRNQVSLANLSLEVAALQTIHQFHLTTQQLSALQKIAAETCPKEGKNNGKNNEAVRSALVDLKDAFVRGEEARIEELEEKLGEVMDQEDCDLDDAVTITPAARKRTGEFLQSLSPRQTAAFIVGIDDLPEPRERLHEALDVVAKANDVDWKEISESIVEDLGWQIGGIDAERCRLVESKVKDYLKKVRSLSARELEKQRGELEKSAQQIAAQASPTFILHNVVEHNLAELLSNPRLPAALDALLNR